MKKAPTIFLQVVIVLVGIAVLVLMLWEPHLEGRNVNATVFEIYFTDPFLAYAYLGSIPFFVALYQGFKGLRYVRENRAFSQEMIRVLRTIRYCALLLAGAIVGADIFLMIAARTNNEDAAGAVMLGLITTCISIIVSVVAYVLEGVVSRK